MESGTKEGNGGTRTILIIVLVILACFVVYFSIMSAFSPAEKIAELKTMYGIPQNEESNTDERLFSDSAYVSMLKEKAFLQAKITMAENDSVSLSLNLADSTAVLEINGVKVHSAKMKKIQLSKVFHKADPNIIYSLLTSPLDIITSYATIRKEPLMIKMAPKDTSEYKPDIIPDTTDYEPVNYIFETNGGIRLYVYQEESDNASDRRKLFWFDLDYRLKNLWSSLKNIAVLKVPEYHPFIKVRLPKADAKIIYRALPRKGQIALYI